MKTDISEFIKLIIRIINYSLTQKRLFIFLMVFGMVFGGFFEYYQKNNKLLKAEADFIIEGEASSPTIGGLGGLFGGGVPGGGASLFSFENLNLLLTYPAIYENALTKKIIWDENNPEKYPEDFFINFYLKKSGVVENEWSKLYIDYSKADFNVSNLDSLNQASKDILFFAGYELTQDCFIERFDEKSSIYRYSGQTRNDTLSYHWTKAILSSLEDYYVENKTFKLKLLIDTQEKRVDSLKSLVNNYERELANFVDNNQELIFETAKLKANKLEYLIEQNRQLYTESLISLDQLKFDLVRNTPIINKLNITRFGNYDRKIYGGFTLLGLFIGLIIALFTSTILMIFSEQKEK